MKVAIVHDYFVRFGGAERVVFNLHSIFPSAPIYTIFANKEIVDTWMPQAEIRELSPGLSRISSHRYFARKYPRIIESCDLSNYDVVISSGSFSKGLITRVRTKHISYIHAPTRFLWDWHPAWTQEQSQFSSFQQVSYAMLHGLRLWDYAAAQRPDVLLSNSSYTQERVKKYYNRDSLILNPSVTVTEQVSLRKKDISSMEFDPNRSYFLIVSHLAPYKNVRLALDVLSQMGCWAVVVGDGPERQKLQNEFTDKVKFVGSRSQDEVFEIMDSAHALIFPGEDDFGLVMAEAISRGLGVIALGGSGASDIVQHGLNGVLFDRPHVTSLTVAIHEYNARKIYSFPDRIHQSSIKFSHKNFQNSMYDLLAD